VPDPLQRPSPKPGRRLTPDEVEEIHGVPASTVRSWAHRGRIFAVGSILGNGKTGGRDSNLYDERKLEPLIDAWRKRRRRRTE
jgi:hypothetical protein